MKFPERGKAWQDLAGLMDEAAEADIDWRHGRTPLYVFYASEDVHEIGQRAYNKFFTENALGAKRAFASLKKMEEEVVGMALDLFHGPQEAAGHMTSGGSESIFLAVKAARDRYRDRHGAAGGPLNMVVPYSAHPAFNKAGETMDLEVRRIPLADDLRADVDAMAEAVDERTMLLVGSAPCFPHGVIDPVERLAVVARDRDVWLHVDACVGGYLAPFVRMLDYPIRAFDFEVPGVRSLSADLHKFGFCPKPASTLFFRTQEDFERSVFAFEDWPNGRFSTATLVGTRPGGGVAASWAVLNYLGTEGYKRIAAELMRMTQAYVTGIEAIDGLRMWTRPDLTIINFGSDEVDVFSVADRMAKRGWLPGLTQAPRGMHAMLSMLHDPVRDTYLEDLASAVAEVRETGETSAAVKAAY